MVVAYLFRLLLMIQQLLLLFIFDIFTEDILLILEIK
nr:MAG TPA: hypothetical protein [Caudoviricetes sp.]